MNTKGEKGESTAREYLESLGYIFVASNFTCRYGEIDLIMRNGEYIVFVEVKQRKNRRFADGIEAVTLKKQRKIILTATYYIQYNNPALQPRFDIVEVYTEKPEVNHVPGAFICRS